MKIEYNENDAKPVKNNRKRRKKRNRIIAALVVIVAVIGVTVALMLTVFFNVKEIKIIGSSVYSEEQIIYASGIMNGDNLLKMSVEDIEIRIEESLPYIKDATVKKKFPDKVGIEVTPATEKYTLEMQDGMYVCDEEYKILRNITTRPEGVLRVKGLDVETLEVGKTLKYKDNQQRDVLTELLNICSDNNLEVTFVDIKSLVDIRFAIGDKVYVKLGSYTDLGGKLTHLKTMLLKVDKDAMVSISLDSWSLEHKEAVSKYENIDKYLE